MNILISLNSRVLGEALYHLIKEDAGKDIVFVVHGTQEEVGFRPDVILVDCHKLREKLAARGPETKVVMIDTGLEQDEVTNIFLLHRLDGVISTDADAFLLKKALNLVNEGQIWIDNSHLKTILSKAGSVSRSREIETVSKREHEILEKIAQGKKNKEIATELFMSDQTVKSHLGRIFRKFNVSSRTQLISLLMHDNHFV